MQAHYPLTVIWAVLASCLIFMPAASAQSAAEYNDLGAACAQKGQLKEAISYYSRGLKIDPAMPFLYMNRGSALDDLGDHESALKDHSKAISLNPRLSTAYFNRAVTYMHLHKYNEALADANEDLRLNPSHERAYVIRAAACMELGNLSQAKADFDRALALDPRDSAALSGRASVLNRGGKAGESLPDLDAAIRQTPDNTGLLAQRAQANFNLKHYDRALADLNKLLALMPGEWTVHLLRGNIYWHLKQNAAAISDFSQALKLKPHEPEVLYARAVAYGEMERNEEALKDFDEYIALKPTGDAFILRGCVHAQAKLSAKAIEDFSRAISLSPDNMEARWCRAKEYFVSNQYQKCLDDLDKVLTMKPNFTDAHHLRSLVRGALNSTDDPLSDLNAIDAGDLSEKGLTFRSGLRLDRGDIKGALSDATKAIALKPTSASYEARASIYLSEKNLDLAAKDYEKALALNPRSIRTCLGLGVISYSKEQWAKAASHFDAAIANGCAKAFAYSLAGKAYLLAGDLKAAIAHFNRVIDMDPTAAGPLTLRAAARFQSNDLPGAVSDATRSISLEPKRATVPYETRGRAYLLMEQPEKALKDFESAIALDGKDTRLIVMRSEAHRQLKQNEQALSDLNLALSIDPYSALALKARISLYSETSSYDKMIEDLSMLIKGSKGDAEAYARRADVFRRLHQYKNAQADIDSGLAIKNNTPSLHDERLQIYLDMNETALAEKELEILDNLKLDTHMLFWRGIDKFRLGKLEPAASDLTNYIDKQSYKDPQSMYATVIASTCYRRTGQGDKATALLQNAAEKWVEKDKWPCPIVSFFNGTITKDDLLKAADDNDKKTEAMTYLALADDLAKDGQAARKHLRWVIANGNKDFTEYSIALSELRRLDPTFTIQKPDENIQVVALTASAPPQEQPQITPKQYGKSGFATAEEESAYLSDAKRRISKHWSAAAAPGGQVVLVRFTLGHGGEPANLEVESAGQGQSASNSALSAIEQAAPFRPLPAGAGTMQLKATFTTGQNATVDVGLP